MRTFLRISAFALAIAPLGSSETLRVGFLPGPNAKGVPMEIMVDATSFVKLRAFPGHESQPGEHPAIQFSAAYMQAAQAGNTAALLDMWHSLERGHAQTVYTDPKNVEKLMSTARSLEAFYVMAAVKYGEPYTLVLALQKFKDRTFKPVVTPLKADGKVLKLTNDLKSDPAFVYIAHTLAAKLKDEYLRKNPEIAQ